MLMSILPEISGRDLSASQIGVTDMQSHQNLAGWARQTLQSPDWKVRARLSLGVAHSPTTGSW